MFRELVQRTAVKSARRPHVRVIVPATRHDEFVKSALRAVEHAAEALLHSLRLRLSESGEHCVRLLALPALRVRASHVELFAPLPLVAQAELSADGILLEYGWLIIIV